jgi:diguanylate cyclase (GGDEF)-like protein
VRYDDETVIRKAKPLPEAGEGSDCLMVLSGQSIGKLFKLNKTKLVIGRSPDADISLDDEGVSRHHAKLLVLGPELIAVEDLASTNGTFVNGQKVSRHALGDGDRIQVGCTTLLKFSYHNSLEEQFQQQLYMSATRDAVTQTYNKRFFEDQLSKDFTHARRHNSPISLLILDVDHFRRINEACGHVGGDNVLKQLATLLTRVIRNEDVLCRLTGEEFAIIARGSGLNGACVLAERLRGGIERHGFEFDTRRVAVTVSVGVSSFTAARHSDHKQLFDEATKRLQDAKATGRNCVRFS